MNPHPVTAALDDLESNFSFELFRHYTSQTREALQTAIDEADPVHDNDARRAVLRAADLQLARSTSWVEKELDLLALALRNLIELYAWALHISKGEAETIEYFRDGLVDLRELFEKHAGMARAYNLKQAPEDPLLIEHGSGKRLQLGRQNIVEELLYKLCSKLIHPSAFHLNKLYGEAEGFERSLQVRFSVEILTYGWNILTAFHPINWIP